MAQKKLRCVIMNRWSDEFSAYERYIDHAYHCVAYIVTPEGQTVLDNKPSAHVAVVPDFKDQDILSAAVSQCKLALGGIDCLISLSEFDLTMTAKLREIHQIPGQQPNDVARFRDKTIMKTHILAAGLRAPRFAALDSDSITTAIVSSMRYPLIVKPRCGAASIGVHKVATQDEFLKLLPTLQLSEYECEEFIEGQIFHVDGIVSKGEIHFQKASRYIGTCFDFAHGKPLGSITLAASEARAKLLKFTTDCLQALDLVQGAFHLEIIDGADGLYFLEIGARVGGGEIPFTMLDVFGIDFYQAWVQQQLDPEFEVKPTQGDEILSGFLIIPEPVGKRLADIAVPDNIQSTQVKEIMCV